MALPVSPPGTPIEQTLESIAALQSSTVQNACIPNQPFIELGDGNAPTLDYNIPQTSAFTTYGTMATAYIDPKCFKQFTFNVPTNNFYTSVANMPVASVNTLLYPSSAVASQPMYTAAYATAPYAATAVAPNPAFATAAASPGMLSHVATTFSAGSAAFNASAAQAVAAPAQLVFSAVQQAQPSVVANIVKASSTPLRPVVTQLVNNFGQKIQYIPAPQICVPRILVIEEYTTASYLGPYGAGRVVNSFSLFPGERTTISVSTYQDQTVGNSSSSISTTATADNVIDSMSDSAASEFDNALQAEQGNSDYASSTDSGSGSSFSASSDSQNSSKAWNVGGSVSLFGMVSIGGGYGQSNSDTSTSSGGMSNTYGYSSTGIRSSNSSTIDNAINKTVQSANAARQSATSVNTTSANSTTSTFTASSGSTSSTIRELYNPNVSCVLNIIARVLLQQYTTITYLSNLKFAYTNGYYETNTIVDLPNLVNMLTDIIEPGCVDTVLCTLLSPYCSVMNYQDNFLEFIELITVPNAGCVATYMQQANANMQMSPPCVPTQETFWRKKKACVDTYTDGVLNITVNGVILSVTQQTLLTPSIIWDALLGQGNALDCFNQKAQDATATAAYINNLSSMQQLEDSIQNTTNDNAVIQQKIGVVTALSTISDVTQQAILYKKVFGDCCDVPQSCCGGCTSSPV